MKKLLFLNKKISKGFTLIELLIVIAVLGILAAVILVAIDPVEQLARGRDASRKTAVGQLGRAIQAYYTNTTQYPLTIDWTNNNATNVLVTSGEIKALPILPALPLGNPACTGNSNVPTLCYKVSVTNAVIYTKMESKAERSKIGCTGPYAQVFYVYATADGRSGIILLAPGAEPLPDTNYTYC